MHPAKEHKSAAAIHSWLQASAILPNEKMEVAFELDAFVGAIEGHSCNVATSGACAMHIQPLLGVTLVGAGALPDDVCGVQVLGGIVPVTVPLPQGSGGVVEGEGAVAEGGLTEGGPVWLLGWAVPLQSMRSRRGEKSTAIWQPSSMSAYAGRTSMISLMVGAFAEPHLLISGRIC